LPKPNNFFKKSKIITFNFLFDNLFEINYYSNPSSAYLKQDTNFPNCHE
jgi:hypothetical protein